MPESFDAFQLFGHVLKRWRVFAGMSGGAVAIALAVSLLVPKQYTAKCRILVEAPLGTDLRSAMAVSPIYLESLRTYEHFASSDSTFRDALDRFQLRTRNGGATLESLKQKVLKVQLVRNTKILEIAVTLTDPAKAHALASYLAQQTVSLNRSVISEGNRDAERGAGSQLEEARRNRDRAEAEWGDLIAREPIEGLQQDMESQRELKARVQRDLLSSEADIAEYAAGPSEQMYSQGLRDARTRADALRKQVRDLDRSIARSQTLLAARIARREKLQAERKSADAVFTAIDNRVRELRGELAYRGERLDIIDSGIVPERPSSPNIPLNAVAALLAGFTAALLGVSLEFGYRQRAKEAPHNEVRMAGRNADG